jgi:hypothetical protein
MRSIMAVMADGRSMMLRDAAMAVALVAAALAGCASPHAAAAPDSAIADVSSATVTGLSISMSEIDFVLTAGPAYSIARRATDGNLAFATIAELPAGASAFADVGADGGSDTRATGGLNTSWDYTYEITIDLDGAADTRFSPNPFQLALSTYRDNVTPPPAPLYTQSVTSTKSE